MMPPRYFKDRFYFLLVAILFLGKKQVLFPFPEEQNSWWRFRLHQESTKALGGLLVDFLAESWCPPRK